MPLHLNAITNNSRDPELLAWLFQKEMDLCEEVLFSENRRFLHLRRSLEDTFSKEKIGALVYTVKHNEEEARLELLDLDLILYGDVCTSVRFLRRLEGSSDSNEYYEVECVENGVHLEAETVNRHTEKGALIDVERAVSASVFPFLLSVYADMDAFHRWAGMEGGVPIGDTDYRLATLSETFGMPGGLFNEHKSEEEHYSFLIGRVRSYREVQLRFGNLEFPFVLAQVETALGTVPVAMGREVFDLKDLKEGCIIAMNADVKLDIADKDSMATPAKEGQL